MMQLIILLVYKYSYICLYNDNYQLRSQFVSMILWMDTYRIFNDTYLQIVIYKKCMEYYKLRRYLANSSVNFFS